MVTANETGNLLVPLKLSWFQGNIITIINTKL